MSAIFSAAAEVPLRYRACADIEQRQIDWMIDLDVPPQSISDPDVLVRAEVVFNEQGFFDFAGERRVEGAAENAVIIMQRDETGLPADLIAWQPRRTVVAPWLRRYGHLGDAEGPRLHKHGGLPVWPTVLDWLRARRDGVVIINPEQARHELIGPFVAMGGLAHARAILQTLSVTPRVLVAQAQQQEAA
jgi:hypothetical protein